MDDRARCQASPAILDRARLLLHLQHHHGRLAKYESEEAEDQPLGIILCTGASTRQIELLELDAAGIHVAEYLTVLPPQDVLQRKLQDAISAARLRFENKPVTDTF